MTTDASPAVPAEPSTTPDRGQQIQDDPPRRPSGVRKRIVRSKRSPGPDIDAIESDAPCQPSPMRTVTARHFGAIASPITAVLCSFRHEK